MVSYAHEVAVYDRDPARAQPLDTQDPAALDAALRGARVVICAAPYKVGDAVASAAHRNGVDYVDMTEDVALAGKIRELSWSSIAEVMPRPSTSRFVPQCGLAPGFVGILGAHMLRSFQRPRSLRLRVGALPAASIGDLRYDCTWSAEGLINEYSRSCEAVVDGREVEVEPLGDLERVTIDGVEYEAFNTSGGVGDLPGVWSHRLRELNYKTLRYPGHRALMHTLMRELALPRQVLVDAFARLPSTSNDVVVIYAEAEGENDGRLERIAYTKKIRPRGQHSAIQLATASAVCAVVELLLKGKLERPGYYGANDIALDDFLSTTWGELVYARGTY